MEYMLRIHKYEGVIAKLKYENAIMMTNMIQWWYLHFVL